MPADLRQVDERHYPNRYSAEVCRNHVGENDRAHAEHENNQTARASFANKKFMRAKHSQWGKAQSKGIGKEKPMQPDEWKGRERHVKQRHNKAASAIEECAPETVGARLSDDQVQNQNDLQ